jgi:hypothetical protein
VAEAFGIARHELVAAQVCETVTQVNAEQALYGALFVKEFRLRNASFLFIGFFVRLGLVSP